MRTICLLAGKLEILRDMTFMLASEADNISFYDFPELDKNSDEYATLDFVSDSLSRAEYLLHEAEIRIDSTISLDIDIQDEVKDELNSKSLDDLFLS